VTISEFYTGVNMREEPEEDKAERLISRARVISLEEEIARKAGELIARKKQENLRLGLNDIYIAATAAERDKTVLTKDPEDFNEIEEIEVVEWDKY
jgi:predicted nucleic acid-binding protein